MAPWPRALCVPWHTVSDQQGHTQNLAQKPQPRPQQIFYIPLTRVVSLGSPSPEDRLRKKLAFPAPEVEARKKRGERGVGKHPWDRQLTVSMPGGGPRSPDWGPVLPFRENDKKKKKKTRAWTLAPEDWAPSWNCHLLSVTLGELSFNLFELNFLICRWGIKPPPPKCGGKWEDGWSKSSVNC